MFQKLIALLALPILSGCMVAAKELQVETRPIQPRILPSLISQAPENVYAGAGGTRRVLVGHTQTGPATNLWTRGSPPCSYEVLDVIEDKRGAGQYSMASLEADMLQEAIARRGTDIILLEQSMQTEERPPIYNVGYGGSREPAAVMAPIKISNTRYAITRCVDAQGNEWQRIQ